MSFKENLPAAPCPALPGGGLDFGEAPDAGADVLAPLWFKRDGAPPIHPLEAS